MTLVTYLNSVNKSRNYKPWSFSRTSVFKALVLIHNVFLAVYSAWTCLGLINALHLSVYDPRGEYGLAGTLDSLCKMHGPRGLGDAAAYNSSTSAWGFTNHLLHLGQGTTNPDTMDVGRIWNEGLAFYGWFFYVSKFYETLDTFIILAKGKKSSFLQSYHHAGAMLAMWSGIRYMSPPIWMFVMVNSGLHAIMYTYYTLTTLNIRVPKWFKQTLTTLQITQFVVGMSYAYAHLFIAYQIPISLPYLFSPGGKIASVTQDLSSAVSVATATASAGTAAWLKKAALRAVGQEGLAENVLNEQGQTFGVDAVHAAQDYQNRVETRYRDDLQWVHCLDTSGQAFAILLNCVYLAPLTYLFVKFFVTAYSKRQERRRSSTASDMARDASYAGQNAYKGVKKELYNVANEGAVEDDEELEAPKSKYDSKSTKSSHDQNNSSKDKGNKKEKDSQISEKKSDNSEKPSDQQKQSSNKSEQAEEKDFQIPERSSAETSPDLKQDDSFVKVEKEPESPTEDKSKAGEDDKSAAKKDSGNNADKRDESTPKQNEQLSKNQSGQADKKAHSQPNAEDTKATDKNAGSANDSQKNASSNQNSPKKHHKAKHHDKAKQDDANNTSQAERSTNSDAGSKNGQPGSPKKNPPKLGPKKDNGSSDASKSSPKKNASDHDKSADQDKSKQDQAIAETKIEPLAPPTSSEKPTDGDSKGKNGSSEGTKGDDKKDSEQ